VNHPSPRVLICAGHTGGHFFPAVSYAEACLAMYPDIEINLLLNRMPSFAQSYMRDPRLHLHVIPISVPPYFFSFKMILFLLEYGHAIFKTLLLFFKIRPKLVVGFGSYGSVSGVLCGVFFRIPILLHEQNAVAGRANRWLAFFAHRVATSFPETDGIPRNKILWTGFPLRPVFCEEVNHHLQDKKDQKSFTILILGGSQGAKRLNEVALEFFKSLTSEERAHFAVIHIVGSLTKESVQNAYEQLNLGAQVFDFSHQIAKYYKEADLVVSRAGAGTIFELAALGKASILIPYPYAYGHQKQNALCLAAKKAALMIEEEILSPHSLYEAVMSLYRDPKRREMFEANVKQFANREAAQALAENTWSLMCKKN
jgi:UDP-N-acetylglucosamine--N-acetylmuramyl-(pentapeptide) pyrophosphoryl-undecaprenol N-acetylglucosamine transferase